MQAWPARASGAPKGRSVLITRPRFPKKNRPDEALNLRNADLARVEPPRAKRSRQKANKPSNKKNVTNIAKETTKAMLFPPQPVEKLPLLEHNGAEILPIIHHGFSKPVKGPQPAARTLYGARDKNGERHWRGSLHEIQQLIDGGFATQEQANA